MENKNAWEKYEDKKSVMDFAEEYREFISANKTERECVEYFKERAEKNGFVSIDEVKKSGKNCMPATRFTSARWKRFSRFSKSEAATCKTE